MCSMAETTPTIACENCGCTADKYFGREFGSNASPEYFNGYFFDLVTSQRGNNTWHIPSDQINKHRTGTIKNLGETK